MSVWNDLLKGDIDPNAFYSGGGGGQMKPYNTSCHSLTNQPCLASNVQQWDGGQKYLGIEFLLTTSARQQDVLTHCWYIKV